MSAPFIESPYAPRRRRTREVAVGEVRLGGSQPIRIQSMTTTDTLDTAGTADQIDVELPGQIDDGE